ncbi:MULTISPECIES: hypothetical protein [unclassified Microcoleus]|uniref:hypothetical protein n=1 Tax=unclassified Microcoleus TaxID=2642155 RepID=UPI002FD18575
MKRIEIGIIPMLTDLISMGRAAVPFYPVEECWVHQNCYQQAIAILELDCEPSRKDCCKMQPIDFRF